MSIAPALARLDFVDLWLGHNYAEYTGLPGAYAQIFQLQEDLAAEADRVREHCARIHGETGDSGFAIDLSDDVLCRVTVIHDLRSMPVYVLRKVTSEIRELHRIGLPKLILEHVLDPDARGLILIVGEQGSGKTTTASSILAARLAKHGGRALAVEDPPEIKLDGIHGNGRCVQVPVSRKHGSYVDQIRNGMRTGTSLLMIGEIRAADTAREAVQAGVNGMTVITTIHGNDPVDGLRRIITWAQSSGEGMTNASELLAAGLCAVIHQRIERVSTAQGPRARALFRCLALSTKDPQESAIRSKIKENSLVSLQGDIDQQIKRQQFQ